MASKTDPKLRKAVARKAVAQKGVKRPRAQIDAKSEEPLYLQVVRALKDEIVRGVHPVGSQLPTEEELCERFAVSRYTVREALRLLREDHLVSSRKGAGTTVVTPRASDSYVHEVMSINDLVTFATGARFVIETIELVVADDKLASRLGIAAGDEWLSVRGFRHTEGSELPICWTEVYINRDFAAIGFVLQQPIFIAASPKTGINSIAELIARAKAKPNELSYASTGRGRLTHLTMELLQARAGVQLRLVPYAGGPAQAMGDVVADRVDFVLDAYAGLAGATQGGMINMLASTSSQRLPGMENLPTVAETIPDFFVGAWNVMLAPLGTPDAIIRKVNADLRSAVENKEVSAKFAANGAYTRYMTPEETIAFTQSQQKTWRPILEKVARETE